MVSLAIAIDTMISPESQPSFVNLLESRFPRWKNYAALSLLTLAGIFSLDVKNLNAQQLPITQGTIDAMKAACDQAGVTGKEVSVAFYDAERYTTVYAKPNVGNQYGGIDTIVSAGAEGYQTLQIPCSEDPAIQVFTAPPIIPTVEAIPNEIPEVSVPTVEDTGYIEIDLIGEGEMGSNQAVRESFKKELKINLTVKGADLFLSNPSIIDITLNGQGDVYYVDPQAIQPFIDDMRRLQEQTNIQYIKPTLGDRLGNPFIKIRDAWRRMMESFHAGPIYPDVENQSKFPVIESLEAKNTIPAQLGEHDNQLVTWHMKKISNAPNRKLRELAKQRAIRDFPGIF